MGMMGVPRQALTYNGHDSSDFGLLVDGAGVYNAPSRVCDMIDIPGRNGQLALDQKRFDNIEVTYECYLVEDTLEAFTEAVDSVRNSYLSAVGYQRLTDTLHPDEYRLGVYKSGLGVDPYEYTQAATFDLVFNCKPQRYLTEGEEPNFYPEPGEDLIPRPYNQTSKSQSGITFTTDDDG